MKSSELRMFNYIRAKSDKVIEQVLKIEKNKINACNHTFFEPIPLTEEWLLKLGFNLYQNAYYYPDAELMVIKNSINNFSLFSYSETGEGEWLIYYNLNTVHKLQNLFYAFQDEELTIKD